MLDEKYPLRTDITVLSADDPKQKPLSFVIHERNGITVFLPDAPDVPLTKEEDLQPGTLIVVTGMFGQYLMKVYLSEEGVLRAGNPDGLPGSFAILAFGEDERHCWTSTAMVKTRGITKTCITLDDT